MLSLRAMLLIAALVALPAWPQSLTLSQVEPSENLMPGDRVVFWANATVTGLQPGQLRYVRLRLEVSSADGPQTILGSSASVSSNTNSAWIRVPFDVPLEHCTAATCKSPRKQVQLQLAGELLSDSTGPVISTTPARSIPVDYSTAASLSIPSARMLSYTTGVTLRADGIAADDATTFQLVNSRDRTLWMHAMQASKCTIFTDQISRDYGLCWGPANFSSPKGPFTIFTFVQGDAQQAAQFIGSYDLIAQGTPVRRPATYSHGTIQRASTDIYVPNAFELTAAATDDFVRARRLVYIGSPDTELTPGAENQANPSNRDPQTLLFYPEFKVSRLGTAYLWPVVRNKATKAIITASLSKRVYNSYGRTDTAAYDFSQGQVFVYFNLPPDKPDLEVYLSLTPPATEYSDAIAIVTSPVTTITYGPPGDLAIDSIEVTQVVQKVRADGTHEVPLVPGKKTVARVYLKSVGDNAKPISNLTGTLQAGGFREVLAPYITPHDPPVAKATVEPDKTNSSLNFVLPDAWTRSPTPLTLTARVRYNDNRVDPNTTNNEKPVTVSFQTPPNWPATFLMTSLQICMRDATDLKCPANTFRDSDLLIRKLLPLPDSEVLYGTAVVPVIAWPARFQKEEGRRWPSNLNRLAVFLLKYRALVEAGVGADWMVTWLPAAVWPERIFAAGPAIGLVQEWCAENSTTCSTMNQNLLAAALAGGKGGKLNERETFKYIIPDTGFDTSRMRTVPSYSANSILQTPEIARELAEDRWISATDYTALYNAAPQHFNPVDAITAAPVARTAGGTGCSLISGQVDPANGTATLDPVYRTACPVLATGNNPAGKYCLRFGDGATPDFCFDTQPLEGLDTTPFVFKLALPPDLARISLRQGNTELASLKAASGPPRITITAPTSGDQWQGIQTLRWNAIDPDGNTLVYAVLYSSDNGASWWPLTTDITDTSYELNTAQIPGGAQARIRVVASSGLTSASAEVGPFEIIQKPALAVSSDRLDFPNVVAGASIEAAVEVSNPGNGPLTLTIALQSPDFSLTSPSASTFTIRAGQTESLRLRFSPLTEGPREASLALSGSGLSSTIALTGAAYRNPVPSLSLSSMKLDFGSIDVGKSKDLPLQLRNDGAADLRISSIAVTGAGFTIAGMTPPESMAADATRPLTVRFTPTAAGPITGTLTVASDDPTRPSLRVTLAGAGITSAAPAISLSPSTVDFGNVATGQSADRTLTVRNSGTAALTIATITTSNNAYSLPNLATPFTLQPNDTRAVTIRFSPTTTGGVTAMLTIASNDPARSSVIVPLTGTGQSAPTASARIEVTPTTLDFGNVSIAATKDLTLTVSGASGAAPLTVNSITSDNPRFTIASPPTPFTTGLTATVAVTVRFSPTAAGTQTGALRIASNAANAPTLTVNLTGTGAAASTQQTILAIDDGSFERVIGAPGGPTYFLNRLTPPSYPATLKAVRIYFHDRSGSLPADTPFTLLSGANPTGSQTISSPQLRGASARITALAQFTDYAVPDLTITSGDFLVGFLINNPENIFPMAQDTSSPQQRRSYYSTNGSLYQLVDSDPAFAGNNAIRALVVLGQ